LVHDRRADRRAPCIEAPTLVVGSGREPPHRGSGSSGARAWASSDVEIKVQRGGTRRCAGYKRRREDSLQRAVAAGAYGGYNRAATGRLGAPGE
jgi:hypothetical protein